jgi:hypothetical protein
MGFRVTAWFARIFAAGSESLLGPPSGADEAFKQAEICGYFLSESRSGRLVAGAENW